VTPYRAFLIGFVALAAGAAVVLAGVIAGVVGPDAGLTATFGLMGVAAAVAGTAGYWLVRRDDGR
jgi:hypothetical protein